METSGQRSPTLDSIKGFLILLVVFGHLIETSQVPALRTLYQIIYVFHMPCFVFLSGLNSKNDETWIQLRIGRFFILSLTWMLIYGILIFQLENRPLDPATPYWLLWYLYSLISWYVILYFTNGINSTLLLSTAGLLAILSGALDFVGYKFSAQRTLYFLVFFIAGFCCSQAKHFTVDFARKIPVWLIGSATILAIWAAIATGFPRGLLYGSFNFNLLKFNFAEGASSRAALIVLSFLFISIIFCVFYKYRLNLFSKFGRYSMTIFLVHGLLVVALRPHLTLPNDVLIELPIALTTAVVICIGLSSVRLNEWLKRLRLG